MSIWDDPDLRIGGNYVKWQNPGDSVTGEILALRKRVFDDGKAAVELIIKPDDGDEVTVTASQYELKDKLAEVKPAVGDRIGIRFDSVEQLSGGKTLKHFTVQVQNGTGAPAAEPEPAQAAPTGDLF